MLQANTLLSPELLAQLERTDYEIAVRENQAGLDSALAGWRNADSGLERIRGLYENNNASQNELDQAVSLAQAALASVESARQELARAERRLGYTTLRAPVDGAIATVPVELNENVVPGDTVWLESGNRVPADLRLLSAHGLEIDESLLTGESLAVSKDPTWNGDAPTPIGDRRNMVFAGSIVVRGRARGMVVTTGPATNVGQLALDVMSATGGKPPIGHQ